MILIINNPCKLENQNDHIWFIEVKIFKDIEFICKYYLRYWEEKHLGFKMLRKLNIDFGVLN